MYSPESIKHHLLVTLDWPRRTVKVCLCSVTDLANNSGKILLFLVLPYPQLQWTALCLATKHLESCRFSSLIWKCCYNTLFPTEAMGPELQQS